MFIRYCEDCGIRVAAQDVPEAALGDVEYKIYCPVCSKKHIGRKPATAVLKPQIILKQQVIIKPQLSSSAAPAVRAEKARAPAKTQPQNQKSDLFLMIACGGVALLALVAAFFFAGGGASSNTSKPANLNPPKPPVEPQPATPATPVAAIPAETPGQGQRNDGLLGALVQESRDSTAFKLKQFAARWPFDENNGTSAVDSTGGSTAATLHGKAAWTSGRVGAAAVEVPKGTGNYVDLGSAEKLNFAAGEGFTIAGWVNTTDSVGPIVSMRNQALDPPLIDIAVGFDGLKDETPGALRAIVRCDDSGTNAQLRGCVLNDGAWHHFALTRARGGKLSLFCDGKQQSEAAIPCGPITTNLRALGVELYWIQGKANAEDHQCLGAKFDDIRIYKFEMSASDIGVLAAALPE